MEFNCDDVSLDGQYQFTADIQNGNSSVSR